MSIVNKLQVMLADHVAQADAILARAADGNSLSATENEQLEMLHSGAEALSGQIRHYEGIESARRDADALAGRIGSRESVAAGVPSGGVTLGGEFVRSDAFAAWGGRGQSGVFTSTTNLSTVVTADDGSLGNVQKVPGVLPKSRTPLLDAVAKIPVSSTSVEYEVWTRWVAGTVAEGAAKPQAGVFSLVNKPLETWAHWKKISRQYRADEAYLTSVINQQLVAGVTRKAEASLVAAVLATTTPAKNGGGAGKFLEGIRNAIAAVDPDWGVATHIVMHPEDFAAADIQAMTNGHTGSLLGVGPWGLSVIPSSAATKGTAVVFDVDAVVCYLRTGIEVFMTDSDISGDGATATSDFRHNIVTVLAEQRGLGVLQNVALAVPAKAAA